MQDVIIYINNGLAYIPTCKDVASIKIEELKNNMPNFFRGFGFNSDKCFKDFEIKYRVKDSNITKQGFLREENIISQVSSQIECFSDDGKELIVENKFKLLKNKNKTIASNYTSSVTKLRLKHNNLLHLFNHHKYLVNGTDFVEEMDEILRINNGEELLNENQKDDDITIVKKHSEIDYFKNIINEIGFFISDIFKIGFKFLFIGLIVFLSYILFKFLLKLCSILRVNYPNAFKYYNPMNIVENNNRDPDNELEFA